MNTDFNAAARILQETDQQSIHLKMCVGIDAPLDFLFRVQEAPGIHSHKKLISGMAKSEDGTYAEYPVEIIPHMLENFCAHIKEKVPELISFYVAEQEKPMAPDVKKAAELVCASI